MDIITPDAAFDPAGSHNRRALERSKRRRPLSQRLRLAARQTAEQHPDAEHVCQKLGIPCYYENNGLAHPPTAPVTGEGRRRTLQDVAHARRVHLERDLKYQHGLEAEAARGRSRPVRVRNNWTGQAEDEGLELARSSVPLPSDRNRLQRHPSLGREDAFCDASTFKGRGNVRVQSLGGDEDAQIAELYRMGLLYDDEEGGKTSAAAAAAGLTLNTIYHDEPSYSIRPAKRSRKLQRKSQLGGAALDLDLSFADLGDDDDLARYLVSPAETNASSRRNADTAEEDGDARRHTRKVSAPLRVVYELDHNAQPSFDVDTSQPPDLIVDDSLSDYDCFTDSDVDEDMPSQEVDGHDDGRAAAATASGAWVLLGDDS